MNIEAFRQIQALIREEPSRANMDGWLFSTTKNECGTAGCIAGWALVVKRCEEAKADLSPARIKSVSRDWRQSQQLASESISFEAREFLQIDEQTAHHIFHLVWPRQFQRIGERPIYYRASAFTPGTTQYAERICDVIDYLIDKFPEGINEHNKLDWYNGTR